ncbi:MAG: hypothetical protein K2H09_00035 [Treponemataceae bacterium]|nr:hypothetical protein [Treponemataceae bacterium]
MVVFVFLLLFLSSASNFVFARDVKPLYKLPEQAVVSNEKISETKAFLAGSSRGLFKITSGNSALPLWTDGAVEQIVRTEIPSEDGKFHEVWYFRTDKGILFSSDLEHFELRNEGLPFLTLKSYDGGHTEFDKQVQALKDVCVNPLNSMQIVTATKDNVYLSRDGGKNWKSLGSMSRATSGIKAVAVASMPVATSDGTAKTELVVFMSHPIFGFSYIKPDAAKPSWVDISAGFEMMPTMASSDEISDILPVLVPDEDGVLKTELYVSQMYLPRIYKFNWNAKRAECVYRGGEPADSIDGMTTVGGILMYTTIEGVGALNMNTLESPGIPEKLEEWKKSLAGVPGFLNAAWIPYNKTGFKQGVCLNELWMLYPASLNTEYGAIAAHKKSLYVSAYQCRLQSGIDKFKKLIKDNNLNSLVIDMKDDYGLLRYDAKDPLVLEKGKITQYAVNLDHFVEEFKQDGVYLIARIVVFKDRNLASYGKSKYAVWNYNTQSPWVGIKEYEDVIDEETGEVTDHRALYYDENWVDPYSPEVWEYNVAIAKELISRGFDEIQFDYIRFPTDGLNLRSASYRWKSDGMDKESALISFLRYARKNIAAPLGIDIYGANGWYRSGTRTGQDVEMLSEYVDVIGPMFYPSHFEQKFLNYAPFPDRPYRIYFYGTYRNTVMARNRAIVRPWVQAFYLNVSYDRQYYNSDYVRKEIFGVRDSVDQGYMYWNNSGEYATISPDVSAEDAYPGEAPEADARFRKPAIGTAVAPEFIDDGISVLDSLYYHGQKPHAVASEPIFTPLLKAKTYF